MITYKGYRDSSHGAYVYVVEDYKGETTTRHLYAYWHIRSHSPDGFEWGYNGSGPAQLALALCADATGDEELAPRVYQEYKRLVVSQLPEAGWTLTQDEISEKVAEIAATIAPP